MLQKIMEYEFILSFALSDTYRPVYLLGLKKTGVRGSVRIYKRIHTEVTVVMALTEISAVAVFYFSVRGCTLDETVVAPLPDKAAAEALA